MHRKPLLQLLRTYRKNWPAETKMADRLIDFVEANRDCFERSLAIGHVTGSAWIVNPAGTHVLLTHHRKLDMWLQLGGHADGNSDILDAAMREAHEESGLESIAAVSPLIFDIDIHLIPAGKSELAHYHHDIRFALQATGTQDYIVSDESHDLAWVNIERLAEVTTEESMLRMAHKWIS